MAKNSIHKKLNISLSYSRCFLCNSKLESNKSYEHVFPKWIQKEFNLWNEKIFLLNNTNINYKQLIIPCCKKCNAEYLSKIENIIKSNYKKGHKKFCEVDELSIYQWTSKIFYGLLFKELSLLIDRKNPKLGKIITPSELKNYSTFISFLKSIIHPIKFVNFKPWSIFIFKLSLPNDESLNFDYTDDLISLCFSIKLKDIGIVISFQDNGSVKQGLDWIYRKLRKKTISHLQFYEFFAAVVYSRRLLNRTPKYISIYDKNYITEVHTLPLGGFSGKPIFDEWDNNYFSRIFYTFLERHGYNRNNLPNEPGTFLSFIFDENGNIKV